MHKLTYYTSSVIHLSLEDYHNAGLTPAETKQIIEQSVWCGAWVQESGINQNWSLRVNITNSNAIADIVERVEQALDKRLIDLGKMTKEDYVIKQYRKLWDLRNYYP